MRPAREVGEEAVKSGRGFSSIVFIFAVVIARLLCHDSCLADDRGSKLSDLFNDEQSYEYGPLYIIKSEMNEAFMKGTNENIEFRNELEGNNGLEGNDKGIQGDNKGVEGHGISSGSNGKLPLKGPRAGGESRGSSEETYVKYMETIEEKIEEVEEELQEEEIPQEIYDYIGICDHKIIYSEGIWKVFYCDTVYFKDCNSIVKMQTFEKNGEFSAYSCRLTPETGAQWSWLYDVIELDNGNIVCLWADKMSYDDKFNVWSPNNLKVQIFDPKGLKIGNETVLASSEYIQLMNAIEVINLSDNKFAVKWFQSDFEDDEAISNCLYHYTLNMSVIDSDGSMTDSYVLNEVFVDRSTHMGNIYSYEKKPVFVDISCLKNGNLSVIWFGYEDGKHLIKVRFFDKDGKALNDPFTIEELENYAAPKNRVRIVSLNNNNSIVLLESREDSYYTPSTDQTIFLFNKEGQMLKSAELNKDFYENNLGNNIQRNNFFFFDHTTVLPNDNVVIFWREAIIKGEETYTYMKCQVFNSDLEKLGQEYLLQNWHASLSNDPYISLNLILKTRILPNGNLMLIWEKHYFPEADKKSLCVHIIDKNGRYMENKYEYLYENNVVFSAVEAIVNLPGGHTAIIFHVRKRYDFIVIGMALFDNDGTLISGLQLIDGRSYEEKRMQEFHHLKVLNSDDLAVFWSDYRAGSSTQQILKMRVFSGDGEKLGEIHDLSKDNYMLITNFDNISQLFDGTLDIVWTGDLFSTGDIVRYRTRITPVTNQVVISEEKKPPIVNTALTEKVSYYTPSYSPWWLAFTRRLSGNYFYGRGSGQGRFFDVSESRVVGNNVSTVSRQFANLGLAAKMPISLEAHQNGQSVRLGRSVSLDESIRQNLSQAAYVGTFKAHFQDTSALESMIKVLEANDKRTNTENILLEASIVVKEAEDHVDSATLEEFENIVHFAMIVESIDSAREKENLYYIRNALANLLVEHNRGYQDYIDNTEIIYENLTRILGIDVDKKDLPGDYVIFAKMDRRARIKIAVDDALEELRAKDKAMLKRNEKEALKIDKDILAPLRSLYIDNIRRSITDCLSHIKERFQGKFPLALSDGKDGTKAFFLFEE